MRNLSGTCCSIQELCISPAFFTPQLRKLRMYGPSDDPPQAGGACAGGPGQSALSGAARCMSGCRGGPALAGSWHACAACCPCTGALHQPCQQGWSGQGWVVSRCSCRHPRYACTACLLATAACVESTCWMRALREYSAAHMGANLARQWACCLRGSQPP